MLTALKAAPGSRQPDAAKCYPVSSRSLWLARDADSIHAGLRPASSTPLRYIAEPSAGIAPSHGY